MKKILFFNFDGTDNEPADAMQDKNFLGTTEDNSITNILKTHLLLGGNLQNKTGNTVIDEDSGSRSFYYNGVGTYGNYFERKFNSGLATESADVSTILRLAKLDFKNHFTDEGNYDYVVVTGFSRGGALARRFASIINGMVNNKPIIIEGIFDTVASIGLPNMSRKDRPTSDVVFEHGHTLPSNVLKALHLVSLDDKRKAFQPTLMNQENRVTEVWFPGAHSDVGGGYNFDGLSDNSLRFFLDWFEDLTDDNLPNKDNLGIRFKSSKNIDYNSIFNKKDNPNANRDDSNLHIGADDVQIDPNPFGINHQQDRTPLIDYLTLTDRVCCVIRDDKIIKEQTPVLHYSVAERIGGDRNYRPKSLENTAHKIIYPDLSTNAYIGYSDHKLKYKSNLKPLTNGASITTRVYAHLKFNHTGVLLNSKDKYTIEVRDLSSQKWNDGGIKALDGDGWNRDDVELGFKEFAIAAMEPFRRVTDSDDDDREVKWFSLCGCIEGDVKNAFLIGNKLNIYQPKTSGELCAFANDLDGYYGNNSGYLNIKITHIQ